MSLRRFVPVLFVLGLCAAGLRAQQQFSLLATVLDPAKGTSSWRDLRACGCG
jgi:hypothetical protein